LVFINVIGFGLVGVPRVAWKACSVQR